MANVGFGLGIPQEAQIALTGLRMAFPDLASKIDGKLLHFAVPPGEEQTFSPAFTGDMIPLPMSPEAVRSAIGLPVMMPIKFVGRNYKMLDNGQIKLVQLPDIYLPFTSIVEVSRSKSIAKSAPNGVSGTHKELWAFQDWQVSIRGMFLPDQPYQFPQEAIKNLAAYDLVADSIEVENDLFNLLGIKRLVIENLNITQIKGQPNAIPFQLSCISDQPVELLIEP